MFFSLVANDRPRFDGLLHWTKQNLDQGDLSSSACMIWRHSDNNQWRVLGSNSAADALFGPGFQQQEFHSILRVLSN